jgi:bifunctional non-homologous end joining protein LigD
VGAKASWVEPMLATLADPLDWSPTQPQDWTYERKLDGLRCLAVRNGGEVGLWSRNRNSFNERFPLIVEALSRLSADHFSLDGEIVAFDGADFRGFADLQRHGRTMAAVLCAFDLPQQQGRDLTRLPLTERKRLLRDVIEPNDELFPVEPLAGDGVSLLREACAKGWEGLVAKRAASAYVSGRSLDWRKLKCSASQELVIGGWTEPQGSRTELGALLLGYYDAAGLRYAGKVGTGFDTSTLHLLGAELRRRERTSSPFVDVVRDRRPHWAAPELIAEVSFSEWTRDGRLRHPRFEGLREDKDPRSVVREQPPR